MVDYTITKKDARKIFLSRLPLTISCAFLGIFMGLYQSFGKISTAFIFEIVIPMTILLLSIPVCIGMFIGINKMTDTNWKLENNSISETKSTGEIIKFNFDEIKSVKENIWGLVIKNKNHKIFIPKQLPVYGEIKMTLTTLN